MARGADVIVKEIAELAHELVDAAHDDRLHDDEAIAAVANLVPTMHTLDGGLIALVGHIDATNALASTTPNEPVAWLKCAHRAEGAWATETLRLSRQLRQMPATEEAFEAGLIGRHHVRRLAGARRLNAEAFERDEEALIGFARTLPHKHFERAIAYWRQLAADDNEEDLAAKRHRGRYLHSSKTLGGCYDLKGRMDPIGGAIHHNELARLERIEFEKDWREAEARLGRRPALDELARTSAQRRHDAAVEMAKRSHALPDGTPNPRPLVTVVVGHPVIERLCQLADGTVVTPGQILPLFTDCDIERVVFGPDGRAECGKRQRFFTGATRRAVEIRDLHCTAPGCDVPYEGCEVDHIRPHGRDGETTQQNGRLACPHHNRGRPADGSDGPHWGGAGPPGPAG
ncbi:MAG: hypothetical protein QOG03_160 [Actinomycetota bacterium]|jgi:hypothetical protein|nr:hypothetical protein [Actinomycetota bacterium]